MAHPELVERLSRRQLGAHAADSGPRPLLVLRRWLLAVSYTLPSSYLVLSAGSIGFGLVGAFLTAALVAGVFGNRVLAGTAACTFAFVSVFILVGFSVAAGSPLWIPLIAGSGLLAVSGLVVAISGNPRDSPRHRAAAIGWLAILSAAIWTGDQWSVFHWPS